MKAKLINEVVEQFQMWELPAIYVKESGEKIVNFRSAPKEIFNENGFYDIQRAEPTANEIVIKQLVEADLDLAQKLWIEKVRPMTAGEITKYNEVQESKDTSASLENKFRDDGRLAYNQLKHYLRRKVDNGDITLSQFNNIYIPLKRNLFWLNFGDWDITKEEIDSITPPGNVDLLEILNTVKNKINTYITNNY